MNKLILRSKLSPGDIVMLTALVRDIHKTYPDKYITDVDTSCSEIWQGNPYITDLKNDKDARILDCDYPLIHESNQKPFHFVHGYIQDFNKKMNLNVIPSAFCGDIHLKEEEKKWISQAQEHYGDDRPYWIIVSGGKHDYTAKWWNYHRCQAVVDYFKGTINFVQVGEGGHHHPSLEGVLDLRGKTDLRQLIRLVYHSVGVVCPVTSLMHFAAAIPNRRHPGRLRPCVVIAGGREGSHWEAYPGHQYLHTIGMLDCCQSGGCWKSKIKAPNEKEIPGQSYCTKPTISEGGIYIPKCLDMIKEWDVIRAINKYEEYNN